MNGTKVFNDMHHAISPCINCLLYTWEPPPPTEILHMIVPINGLFGVAIFIHRRAERTGILTRVPQRVQTCSRSHLQENIQST